EQPLPLQTEVEIERTIDYGAIGMDAKAPWESDGVKWHTQQRIARNGNVCRWEGSILTHIVDYIDAKELLGIPDWEDRTTVSVAAPKKPMFWFFRAITNEEWLLRLKVQVPKGVFTQEELDKQLDLKPLNDMPELPLYGAHSRVKIETAHDPRFQEIEMKVHYLREIDRPEFWAFIDKAINAFADELLDKPEPKDESPVEENVTGAPKPESQPEQQEEEKPKLNIISANAEPWKVLGRTWHLMPSKGFHKNRRPKWKAALLNAVVTWLEETFNDAEFGWTNKCVVPIKLAGRKTIWGRISTKQTDAVRLDIEVEKNKYSVGELLSIGNNIELDDSKAKRDIVRIRFVTDADLNDAVKSFILKTTK
ncbi:MAG: hypothetical protein IKS45_12580, partial [Thermoguttaceae bacterium]|nr:hypothetical protein [Thermoguttaceae bacterium]